MNCETRIIDYSEINLSDTLNEIKKLESEKEHSQKVEWLWNEKGEFTGHLWEWNCSYSISDLTANGDYKLDYFDEQRLILNLIE